MKIGLSPKPIRNLHEIGPANAHHIEVEQAKADAARILVRRAMDHENPAERIDLGRSRAANIQHARRLMLEAHANDPNEPAVIHRREAEDLERHAIGAVDDAIREQEGHREPQLH